MTQNLRILAEKLRKASEELPYLPRALALVWRASKDWTIAWVVLLVVQGLLPVATVYLTRPLVNGVVASVRSGGAWEQIRPTLVLGVLMAAVLLLNEVLRSLTVWVRTAQSELVQDHISGLVHEKSVAADIAFYDSPDFYDHLHRARNEASYRPIELVESLGSLLQNTITLAAMLGVLLPFGLWLPPALLASTLPACYVVFTQAFREYHWRLRNTAEERRTWYYDWLLTAAETAAELRLFGLGQHFQSVYRGSRRRLREERLHLAKNHSLAELGAGVAGLAIAASALGWMLWKAIRGTGTLGDLALFYQAFNQGLRLMRTMLENVGHLYANVLFLRNLFEFLALQPQIVDRPNLQAISPVVHPEIRFDHVTFRYPGSSRVALEDFNLTVAAGQIVAIVGPNGAGKSTLLKLLCRFYDPDQGRIDLDGVDLRDLPVDHLRRMITVLFQQPVHYNTTAAENIAFGDLAVPLNSPAIKAAARDAGADEPISRLPQGYESLLGRWFSGGAELSVGEWQRLALARAFLRRSPILILDEPTSAMDPWAEADWLERFRRLAADRTALLITHRFTTARHADVIHVVAAGRIVESGGHEELMSRGGRYAEWWIRQRSQ